MGSFTFCFKSTAIRAHIAAVAAILLGSGVADASGFYAYYTRLAYPDASEVALPGRALTGKYADVVVQLATGRFVFSREKSYLPYWEVGASKWPAPEIVTRLGDGPSTRPDNINRASYVRIVESNATQVVVHWHYAPDLTNSHFADFQASYNGSPSSYCQDYVEEYFTIKSDATVTRTVRRSQEKIDAYNSASNLTVQTFSMNAGGISGVTTQAAAPQDTTPAATSDAPIKTPAVASPALWWKFDDAMSTRPLAQKYLTQENVTATDCTITGNAAIWQQGVSGTCLSFDGYTSVVTLPAAKAPNVSAGVTMEAWVAPQEYANSSAAIVDHSGGTANGYSLHMDFLGHLVFRVQSPSGWKTLTTSAQLPLLKWAHVAAVYDPASGLKLYINGTSAGTLAATGILVDAAATDIRIGMSHKKEAPNGTQRMLAKSFLSNVVFDGLIDEVRVYGRPLSASEIASNRTALIPANPQPLQYRVMPSGTSDGTFGARYEKLAYTPAWDNLWRVGDHPDIVVGFDQHPIRMVFWRGTGYGLSTVSENGIWVSDQSPEDWNHDSYAEHMSDKHCRFSHVRLIESTPARVLVHWRVASNRIDYKLLTTNDSWGDWTDEYYAIYPDGVAVRYQEVRANTPGHLGEVIQHEMLNQPGTRPEDNANDQMIVVANLAGETRRYDWSGGSGAVSLDPAISNGNIEYMNLKANYKHYIIGEVGSNWSPFGLWNSSYSKFSCWNHWPVSLVPDDNRNTLWPDRPSSACAGNLYPVRRNVGTYQQQVMNLYGLTKRTAAELAPLAKSWAQAPPIQALADCQGAGYVPAERAYHLTSTGAAPSVRIAASAASPIANLCLVVKDWIPNADAPARLMIDGVAQSPGPNFCQGIVRDTAGKQMLVVWVERSATTPVTLTVLTKSTAPTGLIATPGLAAVALNWASFPGATGYKLWRRNTISGVEQIETLIAPPQRSAGLTIGTPYEFKVSATSSSGDSEWSALVTATPTATLGSQTITSDLGSSLSKERNSPPFADSAIASSGLAVTYSSGNPAVATIDSATGVVTITGVGTTNLLANQAGDAAFAAAPQASQTLTVTKASQTISFDLGLTLRKVLVDPPFANSATASSGLAVTYSSDNPAVATVDSATGVVTIKAIGTAQISANQAGNANYQPATQVSQTLAVNSTNAASTYSNTRIPFINTDTLIGAAVFGNSGTYDGIPFGLWNTPYSTARSLGSGVSMVASASLDSTVALGGTQQYATVTYSSSNAPVSLTLSGLDASQAYRVQYGFCDTRIGAFPYNTDAILTLSDARNTTVPLAIGTVTTADDYALLTTTISGSTSLRLELPRAASGTGPIIAGFAVHRINSAIVAPPNSTPDSLSITKNSTATFSLGDFGTYSDPGGLPLAAVGISTLPLSGSLQFDTTGAGNWANVTLNQEISAATISAGRLRFTPATNATGSPYATLEFKVGNGTLFSAPYLLTITVTDNASITAASFNASTRIPFLDSGTLVGAAVFGGAATFDSIAFSLWNTPFTAPLSLGSGVSVTMAVSGGSGGGGVTGASFGTSQQYQFGAYLNSTPRGMTLTFTGLDRSREYRFQFGYGDTRTMYAYNETVSLTTSDSTSAATPLAFGSAASGDEYALLTATARNTTSLVLTLPQTVSGNHGPMQAGFAVHQLPSSNYNAWAAVNTNGQPPDIDHDNDGLPNGIEYFMGATGSTHTATPAIVNTGGVLTWTWPYDRTAVTTYQLQFSDDLMNWPIVAPSANRILASPDRIQFTLPSGTGKKFFRLVVTPTP